MRSSPWPWLVAQLSTSYQIEVRSLKFCVDRALVFCQPIVEERVHTESFDSVVHIDQALFANLPQST